MKTKMYYPSLLFILSCIISLFNLNAAAQTPVIRTYTPEFPHEGYHAPMIELCDLDDPCSNVSLIEFDVTYDVIFDLNDYNVDGLWFSMAGEAEVNIENEPSESRI